MKKGIIAKWVILVYVAIAIFHPFFLGTGASSVLDTKASFSPPLTKGHILGTDILGRDVLAGIMNGTEIAVKIGFLSVFLATFIALVVGLVTSYFHRFPLRVSILHLCFICLGVICLGYLAWISFYLSIWYFIISLFIFILANVALWRYSIPSSKRWLIPVDSLYLRIVEAMKALPLIILLLALVSVFEEFSVNSLIWILALLMWPGLSRYVRAESMKVLSMQYVTAAQAYGASGFRILWKHVVPKLFSSLSVVLAFSISSAILVESTLSFLGLGVPLEQVSWGSMLKEAQNNIQAWWLAVFPGLALFGLVLSLNVLGDKEA